MSHDETNRKEDMLLDEISIAKRRISLDDAQIKEEKLGNFLCHFCSKRFRSEVLFMKHHCEEKRKQQLLHSPIGQAAYGFYREWMRMRKFREQSSEAFLDSRYFKSFTKFAQMVKNANISKPDRYIQTMIENEILPPLWCRESAYSMYLEYMDGKADPLEEVGRSIEYLIKLCEKESLELVSIFESLGSQRVLSLIRNRQLSPWFLFMSKKFGVMLKSLSKDELKAFNLVVNSDFWAKKFQANKQTVEQIKMIVSEMDL